MALEIGIVESGDFSGRALETLCSIGSVSFFDSVEQSLEGFIAGKHVLFIRLKHYWGEKLLAKAPNLRFLCTPTTGLTHIDTSYAERAGVTVISLKGETEFLNTVSATAEHTFGLALALLRRYGQAFIRADDISWERDRFKGYEMKGMSAGIIGMGRVGTQLCGYLSAFGARVFYYDIRNITNKQAERADSIPELVNSADIIFLCASFCEENRKMINSSILEQMKGKYFINTSRGEMADEDALLSLIDKGHFAGVALDVLCGEPGAVRAEDFAALSGKHNVIITPHIGGATYSSMRATEEFIAEKLADKLSMDCRAVCNGPQ